MRDTLEDLYFGKITPNEQDITPGSVLADAMDQAEQCEEMSIGSIVSFPRVGHGVGQKFLANPQSNFLQQKIPENRSFRGFLELLPRFELGTSSLPTGWEPSIP